MFISANTGGRGKVAAPTKPGGTIEDSWTLVPGGKTPPLPPLLPPGKIPGGTTDSWSLPAGPNDTSPTVGAGTIYNSPAEADYARGKIDYSLPSGLVGDGGTPPPPPPGGGGNGFDFGALGADAENQYQSIASQIDAYLKQAREQAIIKFGDPSLASMAGFGLDPQAAAFAQQNYLSGNSDLSRLDKARELQRKAIINRLASRGLLFSGETGYDEQQNESDYGNKLYDARYALLNYLNGLSNNALQQKQQAQAQVAAAKQNALTQQLLALLGGQSG